MAVECCAKHSLLRVGWRSCVEVAGWKGCRRCTPTTCFDKVVSDPQPEGCISLGCQFQSNLTPAYFASADNANQLVTNVEYSSKVNSLTTHLDMAHKSGKFL